MEDFEAYEANQTPFDEYDNGTVSGGTVSSPGWMSRLGGVFNTVLDTALQAAPAIIENLRSTNTQTPNYTGLPANNTALRGGAPNTATAGNLGSMQTMLPWLIGGGVALIGLMMFFMRKGR